MAIVLNNNQISITKSNGSFGQVYVSTRNKFFKGGIIIEDDGESLTFTKPTIDYSGKIYEPKKHKGSRRYVTTFVSEIPLGRYDFDEEESNEDEKIIYY